MKSISILLIFFILFFVAQNCLDHRAFAYIANLPHNTYGTPYFYGATETGRWINGGKNDTNYHHVPENKAQNGRICVS